MDNQFSIIDFIGNTIEEMLLLGLMVAASAIVFTVCAAPIILVERLLDTTVTFSRVWVRSLQVYSFFILAWASVLLALLVVHDPWSPSGTHVAWIMAGLKVFFWPILFF